MNEVGWRVVSGVGFFVLLAIAALVSTDRSAISKRTVVRGVGAQIVMAVLLLATPLRDVVFPFFEALVTGLTAWSGEGARFLFGPLHEVGYSFALHALPIIVFLGSVMAVAYHVGLIQPLVRALARLLSRSLGVSGAESLAAVANIFVGMTDAGLVIAPYLSRLTRSELFSFMNVGMATIAGSVLVVYASMLGESAFAGHLAVASLVSAPAALVVAKLMVPETDRAETADADAELPVDFLGEPTHNVIDAAASGALAGLRMALNVGALLIAFVALIALANSALGVAGEAVGVEGLTLQRILGTLLAPLALLLGIPWAEATEVGAMLGVKTVLNEFIAYQQLGEAIAAGTLSPRSAVIASYALCGFANLGSLAIMLGGIQALAPERRAEASSLGLRSILGGTLATCLTGCLAGVLV